MIRGNLIALNAYIPREETSKINNVSFHIRKLEKEEEIKPKVSRRKEIRIRVEISEIENRKSVENINKTKRWFFEKKSVKLITL